jgi:hypothetical protein
MSFAKKTCQTPNGSSAGTEDSVPEQIAAQPRNRLGFRKILVGCAIAICVISTVFRGGAAKHNKRGVAHYRADEVAMAISEFTKAMSVTCRARQQRLIFTVLTSDELDIMGLQG